MVDAACHASNAAETVTNAANAAANTITNAAEAAGNWIVENKENIAKVAKTPTKAVQTLNENHCPNPISAPAVNLLAR